MGISYKPSNSELPNPVTASGDMLVSGNLVVDGILTAGGISGSGEANTASNVGGGTGVFKGKTGVDLEFKTLVGSGVTINSTTNTIELTASGGGSTNPGGSDTQVQFNQNGSFAGDSGFTYDGSGSAFVSSSFTASSLQLYNEATSSQTVDFSVLSNGSTVLKRSGSNPEIFFNRSDGDQVSFMQFQANAGTSTGFVDSVSKGLSVGLNGKDGYMLARDSGSKLYIGTSGVADAIVIDSSRNATFAKNLSTNGNTTLGDAASDFHKISGSLNISGSQTGLLHVRGDVTASNVMPQADLTYDLGSTTLQWNNIYANELIGNLEGAVKFDAINSEGAAISKGQVVYINGVSGQTPTVGLAACDDASKMPAFGLAAADAANSASVQIVTFGSLSNLNLTTLYGKSFTAGDVIFVETGSNGTSGSLTNIAPTGSNNLLQNMGKVVRNGGGGDGQIKVGGAGRSNATPNLDEGYLFVGNGSDQSVQDNTVFISSSANLVGINNTNPDHTLTVTGDISASVNVSASAFYGDGSNLQNVTGAATPPGGSDTQIQFNQNGSFAGDSGFTYDGSGSVSFGSATSDTHQVTGTLSISGSQPLKVFGPQGGVGGASIIARHTSSIDDWETPISGALVVSADVWTAGEQNTGAVMYVHSQDEAAIIGFKNSSTLISNEQKNAVTSTGGAFVGLVDSNIVIRNQLGNGQIQLHTGVTEFTVDDPGVIIGNSVSDVHQVTGTLTVSGNVSASALNADLIQNTYYSASISTDTSVPTNQYNFINYQLGASLALTASSPVAGASYIILLRQDATGGRVVSFDSATFKFPSGSSTTNSTGSGDVDIVTGISDGSVIYAAMSKKFQ